MFFKNKKDVESVNNFLEQVESYINGDINKLNELILNNPNSTEGKVYNRLSNIMNTLQNKNQESLGIYGEIMLLSEKISDGYLDDRITQATNDTKLEYIKKTQNKLTDKLEDSFKKANRTLNAFQDGDYTQRVDESTFRGGAIQEILKSINFLGEELSNSTKLNVESSSQLNNTKNVLENATNTLSTASSQQAAALEETAASMEEITGNIRATTEKSVQMQELSSDSRDSLSTGSKLAQQTSTTMGEIDNATQSIADAITIIDQIAFQTNILSLNAAVEAATAGEAGKGFAVVAGEVRNLAARSAEAANEIKALVETAREKTQEGNKISTSMLEGYQQLEDKISQTTILIEDVASASREQMQGMDQINTAIAQLDQMTQENTSTTAKVQSISNEVSILSKNMMTLSQGKKY